MLLGHRFCSLTGSVTCVLYQMCVCKTVSVKATTNNGNTPGTFLVMFYLINVNVALLYSIPIYNRMIDNGVKNASMNYYGGDCSYT